MTPQRPAGRLTVYEKSLIIALLARGKSKMAWRVEGEAEAIDKLMALLDSVEVVEAEPRDGERIVADLIHDFFCDREGWDYAQLKALGRQIVSALDAPSEDRGRPRTFTQTHPEGWYTDAAGGPPGGEG